MKTHDQSSTRITVATPARRQSLMIPVGAWPRRMPANMAAAYVGEPDVKSFLRRVRAGEYPKPRIAEGRRRLWLIDDLDAAILPEEQAPVRDVAADL
jgi:hypothetical protein